MLNGTGQGKPEDRRGEDGGAIRFRWRLLIGCALAVIALSLVCMWLQGQAGMENAPMSSETV